jgi:HEAT repeat protein
MTHPGYFKYSLIGFNGNPIENTVFPPAKYGVYPIQCPHFSEYHINKYKKDMKPFLREGKMAQDTGTGIKDLIAALSSLDDFTRVEARNALVAMGSQSIPFLAEALKGPDLLRKWEAAKALGEICDPRAVPALVEALDDEQFDVRWLAAEGLIEMNVKSLRPLFQALMEHADSVMLRQGAHHVLHDLAKGELRVYLAPVLIALESMEPGSQLPRAVSHALESLEKAKIL